MVTEQELTALLKQHGWYLDWVTQYKTKYAYAKRRMGKQVVTRYLKTENKLNELTPAEVLEKIQS